MSLSRKNDMSLRQNVLFVRSQVFQDGKCRQTPITSIRRDRCLSDQNNTLRLVSYNLESKKSYDLSSKFHYDYILSTLNLPTKQVRKFFDIVGSE